MNAAYESSGKPDRECSIDAVLLMTAECSSYSVRLPVPWRICASIVTRQRVAAQPGTGRPTREAFDL